MANAEVLDLTVSDGLLASSVAAYAAGDQQAMSRAVDVLGEPQTVARLLGTVLSDDMWLDEMLARSYWHPNGFIELPCWRPERPIS